LRKNLYKKRVGWYGGLLTGKVIDNNATVVATDGTFTQQIRSDCYSTGGDSGGIVFMPWATDHKKAFVAGIHRSGSSTGSSAVRASNILSPLGISLY
jgi:hypothetical protein